MAFPRFYLSPKKGIQKTSINNVESILIWGNLCLPRGVELRFTMFGSMLELSILLTAMLSLRLSSNIKDPSPPSPQTMIMEDAAW